MAQVYECRMVTTVTVNIRASNAEEAQDWLNMHSLSDVQERTASFDVEYDDQVIGEINEEAAIDISEEG